MLLLTHLDGLLQDLLKLFVLLVELDPFKGSDGCVLVLLEGQAGSGETIATTCPVLRTHITR